MNYQLTVYFMVGVNFHLYRRKSSVTIRYFPSTRMEI